MSFVTHLYDLKLKHMDKTITEKFAELEIPGGIGDLSSIEARLAALENPVSILSFTIISPVNPLEVGEELTNIGFSWEIENFAMADSARVIDVTGEETLYAITTETGSTSQPISMSKTIPSTNSFRLDVFIGGNTIPSTVRTVSWRYPTYYGNGGATIDADGIKELATKSLRSSAIGNYEIADELGYKWIVLPKSLTQPTDFRESGFPVAMQSPIEVTMVNDYGVSIVMNAYRTTNSFSDPITIESV